MQREQLTLTLKVRTKTYIVYLFMLFSAYFLYLDALEKTDASQKKKKRCKPAGLTLLILAMGFQLVTLRDQLANLLKPFKNQPTDSCNQALKPFQTGLSDSSLSFQF